jgi:hypothetical protein
MMWGDVLPKLERENVENRLNQIGHIITTKLNKVNEERLRKVSTLIRVIGYKTQGGR